MTRSSRPRRADHRRLATVLLGLGLAPATALLASPAPIELLQPAAGELLPAGGSAILEWRPAAGFERLGAEEWEAFLSLDGGRTYRIRLTPHLDIERRRFSFPVPDVPTAQARLLLRFGDEVEEVGYELPTRWTIAAGGWARLPPPRAVESSPGEAARPGDPGVVLWVDGTRQGGRLRQRRFVPPPALQRPASLLSAAARPLAAITPVLAQADRSSDRRVATRCPRQLGSAPAVSLPTPSPRRTTCRQNE